MSASLQRSWSWLAPPQTTPRLCSTFTSSAGDFLVQSCQCSPAQHRIISAGSLYLTTTICPPHSDLCPVLDSTAPWLGETYPSSFPAHLKPSLFWDIWGKEFHCTDLDTSHLFFTHQTIYLFLGLQKTIYSHTISLESSPKPFFSLLVQMLAIWGPGN